MINTRQLQGITEVLLGVSKRPADASITKVIIEDIIEVVL